MTVGLVLEGGGMRGMFTAGVLDAFMEQNIQIDKIIGVSAGALFGINYASNQKERALRYNLKYLKDKRYMGFHSLFTTGNIILSMISPLISILLIKMSSKNLTLISIWQRQTLRMVKLNISKSKMFSKKWNTSEQPRPCLLSRNLWKSMGKNI